MATQETAPDYEGTYAELDDDLLNDDPVEGDVAEDDEDLDDGSDVVYRRSLFRSKLLRSYGSCFFSMVFHLVGLIALGLMALDREVKEELREIVANVYDEEEDDELEEIELEKEIEAATEMSVAVVSSAPAVGVAGGGPAGSLVSTPSLSQEMMEQAETTEISIEGPSMLMPASTKLVKSVPDGALGDPRAIVDDYQQAMDRITQELVWMLDRGPVLVIWCFDQSESMKDDQQEIRARIDRVYKELGLVDNASGQSLATAVTSYGGSFRIHTRRPTSNLAEISQAIDSVPIDPSGKEMMCQAVGASVQAHLEYAKRRQMALVLVTDESGDRQNNDQYLEQAIAAARAAKCRVYVLGREAVFGYPYVHIRWRHPQTGHVHWLPIDRGPETAFVEQLQTNGFRRRHDAFPSGFGPYEQTRMTRETNGIFFMLPSLESALVRGEKRRYELDLMKAYKPDLRARIEQITDRDGSQLRSVIWQVINDLNPYNPEAAKIINMRMHFPLQPAEFLQAARREQQKALVYLDYLARAQKAMEDIRWHREQETSPRWQANYDIIYAQIIAYQARIYEYGAYLEYFIQNPKFAPATKPPNLRLVHWDIVGRREILVPDKSQPYIDKAKVLFEAVIQDHPGTPWAGRAENELKRGFGIELRPDYDGPRRPRPPGEPLMPIPKL